MSDRRIQITGNDGKTMSSDHANTRTVKIKPFSMFTGSDIASVS